MHHLFAWIGAQLASALAHAHAHGVFHGDVKPSNVLLTRDGPPLLMDFNLSGNMALSLTAKGGTLPYMPPEQLRVVGLADGSAAQYDQRSDIYSLGAMLYEALTGQTPFPVAEESGDRTQIAKRLLELQQAGPVPIRHRTDQVPPKLAALIESCLRFHPSDRIQQADALAAMLQSETDFYHRLRWRISSNRKRVRIGGSALLSLLVGCGFILAQRPARHERLLYEAIRHREAGQHLAAEDALRESLKANPSYADAQFEIARTALEQKSYVAAHEALTRLEEMTPDARSAAYKGYCFNREQRHGAAIPWYLLAIERGADAPEILNNLGYSYMQGSSLLSDSQARDAAYGYLRTALDVRPSWPTVQLNWIRLAIERNQEDGVAMPDNIPATCYQLVSAKPNCGYCVDRAAAAVALMSPTRPGVRAQGIAHLNRAIELGHGPNALTLRSAPRWAAYREDARLGPIYDLLEHRRPTRTGDRVSSIIEPVSLARSGAAN
jgi:tetratricopeptide (TPR) repeat protein